MMDELIRKQTVLNMIDNECFSYGMCTKVWMNRDATFYCKSGERKTDVQS